jgi:integrase
MARPSKPRYRRYGPGRGAWVSTIAGEYRTLASGPKEETRQEARRQFHTLMAEEKGKLVAGISLRALKDVFLDSVQAGKRPLTYEFYRRHCKGFWEHVGEIAASDVKPYHVTRWLAAHAWNDTTRHGAITAVKRMYRWAKKEGHLETNPLADIEKPSPFRREQIMTDGQLWEVLDASPDKAFRDLLAFARETGCRPSEAMAVEAHHVDLANAAITMKSKTSGATGKPRVIHLTPAAVELCRQLMAIRPEGPLLRNVDGNPWNRHATKSRFCRLRKKLGLGKEATLESLRHGFATDGLSAGVPIKTMAELLGHSSTAMVDRHYSHMHDRKAHLKEAVGKLRPGEPGVNPRAGTAGRPDDPSGPSS